MHLTGLRPVDQFEAFRWLVVVVIMIMVQLPQLRVAVEIQILHHGGRVGREFRVVVVMVVVVVVVVVVVGARRVAHDDARGGIQGVSHAGNGHVSARHDAQGIGSNRTGPGWELQSWQFGTLVAGIASVRVVVVVVVVIHPSLEGTLPEHILAQRVDRRSNGPCIPTGRHVGSSKCRGHGGQAGQCRRVQIVVVVVVVTRWLGWLFAERVARGGVVVPHLKRSVLQRDPIRTVGSAARRRSPRIVHQDQKDAGQGCAAAAAAGSMRL